MERASSKSISPTESGSYSCFSTSLADLRILNLGKSLTATHAGELTIGKGVIATNVRTSSAQDNLRRFRAGLGDVAREMFSKSLSSSSASSKRRFFERVVVELACCLGNSASSPM